MDAYPVTYEADWVEDRSRLHTFFRWLTVIPVALVVWVLSLGAIVTLPVAWIVMVVTGRYAEALYGYHAGLLRAWTRVGAYAALITDAYPPFGLGEEPQYPVRVAIGPAKDEYSRLLALVRLILFIPVYVVAYVLMLVAGVGSFVAWIVIVITGRQMEALQALINMGYGYQARAYAYAALLTEAWPPFDGIAMELEPRAPSTPLGGTTEPPAIAS